ncbi:MAG: NAD-dependent epimerase/dehydratase family protein [Armatimonadetes bacterium]|nr:NAD-dependent epimerase/dehydratase family protein [Armatimonadota bacterium]
MNVFLTGACGFIGGAVLHALVLRGHRVTCLARGVAAGRLEAQGLPGVRVVRGEFTRPEEWLRHVAGHDVAINCVGILRESRRSPFVEVHRRTPFALFEAASNLGLQKVIQISAAGAVPEAKTRYHHTKWCADQRLMELDAPYVIFRPSVVYGAGGQSTELFLTLAALPILPVPGDGEYRLQPIHVDDLVRAILIAVEDPETRDLVVEAGGAAPLSFRQLLEELARWLGRRDTLYFVPIPWPVVGIVAWFTELLGGNGPITRDEATMLRQGNTTDNGPFVEAFGFEPVSFPAGLARMPCTEATRWRAGLAPLRTLLRLALAFVWIYTGIVSAFMYPAAESLQMLARTGLHGLVAWMALYAASLLDFVLGAATALRFRLRLVGWIQIAVIVTYTLILSFRMPELWIHPFGALSKNAVLLVATLILIALED